MDANDVNFLQFLTAPHQLIVPIYQRNYSWTEKQCERLWNDILKIAKKKDIYHFIGSIVFISPGAYQPSIIQKSLLIDGQQRICTIILLLHALGKVIEEKNIKLEVTQEQVTREQVTQEQVTREQVTREQINSLYIFNSQMTDMLKYKLLMNRNDKKLLIDILNDREILDVKNRSSLLFRNYKLFLKKIHESESKLNNLYFGLRKLMVVSVSLTRDHDQPQLIFESLNSTGQALTKTDLIRNYILIDLKTTEQEKIYNDFWFPMDKMFISDPGQFDRFIRDYLTLKTNLIPKIDNIYDDFKKFTENFIEKTEPRVRNYEIIRALIKDIYQYSKIYSKIAFSSELDISLRESFALINKLKVSVAYPFLLKVYNDYKQNIIKKDVFLEILNLIETYVFRRSICEVPTNSLNKTFVLLIKAIDKENYLESIKATLILYKKYRVFPTNSEFKNNLMVKDVYRFRNNKYLLEKLEQFDHKEKTVIEDCSIEHIMPQNEDLSKDWQIELGDDWEVIHEKYKNVLGNLTLTGYNSELGDKPFLEKRDMKGGYKESGIHLSQDLRDLNNWNEQEILKRTEKLANLALKVWTYPEVKDDTLEKYRNQETEVEDSNYIRIIKKELEKLLNGEWEIYPTKRKCVIFRKGWFDNFKAFYSKHYPFMHYTVNSWINNEGFEINVGFNLAESGILGAKFNLRDKFTMILDEIIQKAYISFHYILTNKNTKFKEVLIEDDDYSEDDLKNVAEVMVELISDTYKPIQKAVDVFIAKFSNELENWKSELSPN